MFAHANLNRFDLPGSRDDHQLYIQYDLEPPIWWKMHKMFENYFNISMTYRQDANIQQPYGRILPKNISMLNIHQYILQRVKKMWRFGQYIHPLISILVYLAL